MPQRPPKIHYALVTDDATQWFSYLVAYVELGVEEDSSAMRVTPLAYDDVPMRFDCEFLTDILQRKADLNLRMNIQSSYWFYGTTLSPKEYSRLKKMIKLFPAHEEYLRLGKCSE